MFKVICRCHRTIERHTNSPLADPRRRYLEHLAAGGANPSMMRNAAALMYRAVQLLDLEVDRPGKRTEVEQAAKKWAGRAYPHAGENGANTSEGDFRHVVCGKRTLLSVWPYFSAALSFTSPRDSSSRMTGNSRPSSVRKNSAPSVGKLWPSYGGPEARSSAVPHSFVSKQRSSVTNVSTAAASIYAKRSAD